MLSLLFFLLAAKNLNAGIEKQMNTDSSTIAHFGAEWKYCSYLNCTSTVCVITISSKLIVWITDKNITHR